MREDELDEAALLRRARRGLSPSADDGARVRAALSATLAAAPLDHDAPDGASLGSARALPSSAGLVKLGMAAVVAAATGVGGYWLGYEDGVAEREARAVPRIAEHAPVPASTPAAALVSPSPAPSAREAEPARPARVVASNALPPPAPSASATESPLERETRLLTRVERALRDQNPRFALGLLGELDREIPGGQLAQERQAARVLAHCALGSDSAPKLASEFTTRHAGSAYLSRIAQACAAVSKPPAGETD
jgi:hypothetical protein